MLAIILIYSHPNLREKIKSFNINNKIINNSLLKNSIQFILMTS